MPDDNTYITATAAAELLGCSKAALRKLPLRIYRPVKRAQYRLDEVEQLVAEFRLAREAAALEVLD